MGVVLSVVSGARTAHKRNNESLHPRLPSDDAHEIVIISLKTSKNHFLLAIQTYRLSLLFQWYVCDIWHPLWFPQMRSFPPILSPDFRGLHERAQLHRAGLQPWSCLLLQQIPRGPKIESRDVITKTRAHDFREIIMDHGQVRNEFCIIVWNQTRMTRMRFHPIWTYFKTKVGSTDWLESKMLSLNPASKKYYFWVKSM